jgi:hypothetical protein
MARALSLAPTNSRGIGLRHYINLMITDMVTHTDTITPRGIFTFSSIDPGPSGMKHVMLFYISYNTPTGLNTVMNRRYGNES